MWPNDAYICVGNLTIIGSDNGLSPGRRQAITWTNVGILLIWPLGTNFSEMLIEIHTFSFKKIHLKMSSGKWRPFCLGLNVLIEGSLVIGFLIDDLIGLPTVNMTQCTLDIFSPKNSGKTPPSSPVRAGYGVSFVSSWFEQSFCFQSVLIMFQFVLCSILYERDISGVYSIAIMIKIYLYRPIKPTL